MSPNLDINQAFLRPLFTTVLSPSIHVRAGLEEFFGFCHAAPVRGARAGRFPFELLRVPGIGITEARNL